VLDKNGNGTDSGVIAAINRAIQLGSQYNIEVINSNVIWGSNPIWGCILRRLERRTLG
jgi:hypothetical protein